MTTQTFPLTTQSESEQLLEFLEINLNKIFCVKAHLYERLPELAGHADFKDLKHAILETIEDIGNQISRIKEIYVFINKEPSLVNCDEIIDFIEAGFNQIWQKAAQPVLRDMNILFYMGVIESLELVSFQLLQSVAVQMPDKKIGQLLRKNFDELKADRALFTQIKNKHKLTSK